MAVHQSLAHRLTGGPAGFRKLLLGLGPTFIKIGQFLALRPDLIPEEYTEELLDLFDRVEPFPWSEAEHILTEDLGRLSDVFEFIEEQPVAAGSLAQVHRARLRTGQLVAIKVLRPGIADHVASDLRRTRILARVLELSHLQLVTNPHDIARELSSWLTQEIDLSQELRNMQRLRGALSRDSRAFVPRAYPELSTARVLISDFVDGIPMTRVLEALAEGGSEPMTQLKWKIDPSRLASRLLETTLDQIFRAQFFHADVHPGNLIALPSDVIGFVDFGLCAEIDEQVRRHQIRYLSALYEGDFEQIFRSLMEVMIPKPDADEAAFRADFFEESSRWLRLSRSAPATRANGGRRTPVAHWLVGVMRASRRYRFNAPPGLLAIYRTLLTAEAIAARLDPEVDLREVGKDFFLALQWEDALRTLAPEILHKSLPHLLTSLREMPAQLMHLLTELAEERFTLRVESTESAAARSMANRRVRLLVTAIVSVGFSILLAFPPLLFLHAEIFHFAAATALAALYVALVLQWRNLD